MSLAATTPADMEFDPVPMIVTSAPLRLACTDTPPLTWAKSSPPDSSACMLFDPPEINTASTSKPAFLNSPPSSATQNGML